MPVVGRTLRDFVENYRGGSFVILNDLDRFDPTRQWVEPLRLSLRALVSLQGRREDEVDSPNLSWREFTQLDGHEDSCFGLRKRAQAPEESDEDYQKYIAHRVDLRSRERLKKVAFIYFKNKSSCPLLDRLSYTHPYLYSSICPHLIGDPELDNTRGSPFARTFIDGWIPYLTITPHQVEFLRSLGHSIFHNRAEAMRHLLILPRVDPNIMFAGSTPLEYAIRTGT